jgi:hypothetical protein
VFIRAQNNISTSIHTYINSFYTFKINMAQEAQHISLRLKESPRWICPLISLILSVGCIFQRTKAAPPDLPFSTFSAAFFYEKYERCTELLQ